MSDIIYSELGMTRLSESKYRITVTKKDGSPYPLNDIDLLFISKQKVSDADSDTLHELTLGAGLELDEETEGENELIVTIAPEDTEDLPPTKATSFHFELLVTSPPRKTLGRGVIPVHPSLLQSADQLS